VLTIKVALKRSLTRFRETNAQQCEQVEQTVEKLVHMVSWCAVNASRLLNTVVLHHGFSSEEVRSQMDMQRLSMQCFKKFLTYSGAVQKPCQSLEDTWANRVIRGLFDDPIDTELSKWKYVIDEAARNHAKNRCTKLVFTYESSLRQWQRT